MVSILIVEDDLNSTKLLQSALDGKGFKVLLAMDGEKALSIIKKVTPNIVLLDIDIPKLTGIELARIVKADSELSRSKIIFITAQTGQDMEFKCKEVGGDGFIPKPINVDLLLSKINELI